MPVYLTYKTKGGFDYIPEFVEAVDPKKCIACGRCYKVCPQGVLELVELEDDDTEFKSMEVKQGELCIGCKACKKACPKGCLTHAPAEV